MKNENKTTIIALGGYGRNFLTGVQKSDIFDNLQTILVDKSVENVSSKKESLAMHYVNREDIFELQKIVDGNSLVIVVGGLGGTTTMESLPTIYGIVKEEDNNVLFLGTKPFIFEGKSRLEIANEIQEHIQEHFDGSFIFGNEMLKTILKKSDEKFNFSSAMNIVDNFLFETLKELLNLKTINKKSIQQFIKAKENELREKSK